MDCETGARAATYYGERRVCALSFHFTGISCTGTDSRFQPEMRGFESSYPCLQVKRKFKMKTKLSNGKLIDWDEMFNHSTSHREETILFSEGGSGAEWLRGLWCKVSKKTARTLIKEFGVEATRSRAKRWIKQICGE